MSCPDASPCTTARCEALALLGGLAICGACGNFLTGAPHPPGTAAEYICRTEATDGPPGCGAVRVAAPVVNRHVLAAAEELYAARHGLLATTQAVLDAHRATLDFWAMESPEHQPAVEEAETDRQARRLSTLALLPPVGWWQPPRSWPELPPWHHRAALVLLFEEMAVLPAAVPPGPQVLLTPRHQVR
ncbi:hypothetical protein CFP65_6992 [Kitasatospora sp. MMS16-BH015]|uniref:zinc ribbon domain-containing protein n=1 Tax=Kitasatospora sp. MMS16-BH015 TaxID=2018025 RepID=UPI000CA2C4AE|nr:zinc ribbon domain-containing protein [Kitasatospora sp. MMS16-BH015]AUG81604.1 hypothetical protein CFP65_6992 [Kitasatospora sp. MMS16-BH015]